MIIPDWFLDHPRILSLEMDVAGVTGTSSTEWIIGVTYSDDVENRDYSFTSEHGDDPAIVFANIITKLVNRGVIERPGTHPETEAAETAPTGNQPDITVR